MNTKYPRIEQLNIPVTDGCIKKSEFDIAFAKSGLDRDMFSDMFGVQTCPVIDGEIGFYAWDVEAVLERMISGKATGTQLFWD